MKQPQISLRSLILAMTIVGAAAGFLLQWAQQGGIQTTPNPQPVKATICGPIKRWPSPAPAPKEQSDWYQQPDGVWAYRGP